MNARNEKHRVGWNLWLLFVLFAIINFCFLWVIQTVFLESFYNRIVIGTIRRAADKIAVADDEMEMALQEAARLHILIVITDDAGSVILRADEHDAERQKKNAAPPAQIKEAVDGLYAKAAAELVASGLDTRERSMDNRYYLLSRKIQGDRILFISTPLGVMPGVITTLRFHLVVASIVSLLLASVFSKFLSDKLSDYKGEKARLELLSNITHDLRTPLTLIKGYAEMIEDLDVNDGNAIKADADIIIRESDRLSAIVKDIIDYSNSKGRRFALHRSEFDLGELAEDVIRLFSLKDRFSYKCSGDVRVNADRTQIGRVISNFIANAVSYNHGNGAEKPVEITISGQDGRVKFSVRDYGMGIDDRELPCIWERYFTRHQSRLDGNYSGLGLAISKEILEKHKADFGVESKIGEGSVFWFEMTK